METSSEWKKEYLKDDFVVNATLSKATHEKDLTQVTKNLKSYSHELHESMTEIFKEESEAIVNLAQSLSELSSQITKLTTPLTQFHEEILSLYKTIHSAEITCRKHLEQSQEISTQQHFESLMFSISNISGYVDSILQKQLEEHGVNIALYERAVDEYSINVNHLKESKKDPINDSVHLSIEKKLKLLTDEKFIKALKDRDDKVVHCCLRAYVSLNCQCDAELIYRKNIVHPTLEKIFSATNLEHHNNDLSLVYRDALNFLNHDMSFILDIIKRSSDLKGYDFVINTYWSSADKLLRDNLPQTTASGNPELFQKRFRDTWNFLLEITCRVDSKMHNHPSFQDHMKRFNLAVYFEIRHQQICASFEKDLIENVDIATSELKENSQFKLKASDAFWRSINHCFHPEVYINHLCDHFFKLSLMLISRYLRYIRDISEEYNLRARLLVNCLLDLTLLKKLLCTSVYGNIENSVYNIMTEEVYPLIERAAKCNEKAFMNSYNGVVMQLINGLVEEGTCLIVQLFDIPRLYRKTNKSASEHSKYVYHMVFTIERFYLEYKDLLKEDVSDITDASICKIGEMYLKEIKRVLGSLDSTETSLRKLKRMSGAISDKSSQSADSTSDESKIRKQIGWDVSYFVEHLSKLVRDSENKVLKSLLQECGIEPK